MGIETKIDTGGSSSSAASMGAGSASAFPPSGDALALELSKQLPLLETESIYHLSGVSWDAYRRLLAERDNHRPGTKITYDRGALSVLTTSSIHERWKKTLALIVEAYALDRNIPFESTGNLTISRDAQGRGLEPDETYYFQNVSKVPLDRPLDFTIDPVPDLAIEFEYARSVTDRLNVFATLGLPELWLYDGKSFRILLLESGKYTTSTRSRCLPEIPFELIDELLPLVSEMSGSAVVREFRTRLAKR